MGTSFAEIRIVIRHSDFVISPIVIGLRRTTLKKVALRFSRC
jgi:hypothetical protein